MTWSFTYAVYEKNEKSTKEKDVVPGYWYASVNSKYILRIIVQDISLLQKKKKKKKIPHQKTKQNKKTKTKNKRKKKSQKKNNKKNPKENPPRRNKQKI